MAYVVTLTDFTPIAREDDIPWTEAIVEESLASGGPWTALDTFTLDPVDTDPSNPQTRSFTVNNATTPEGWYRVIFKDAADNLQTPTEPVQNIPDDTIPYWPLVGDVGMLMRSRTKDTHGDEVGTFTDKTRPTYEQAYSIIRQAANEVNARFDVPIPESAWNFAQQAIAYRAAGLIELSYFAEQIPAGRSPYEHYRDLYDQYMEAMMDVIAREREQEEGVVSTPGEPVWWFPPSEELVW